MTSSPLARLWSHAIAALSRLRGSLFPLYTLLAKELRDLRANLRALEAFCRRLALMEALEIKSAVMERGSSDPRLGAPLGGSGLKTRAPIRQHHPILRLWPRSTPMPVRVTLLGPPTSVREIWREQKRTALAAQLARVRWKRKPAHLKLADRIDALQRFLDAPRAAIRRLARKLHLTPKLAYQIAARRAPSSPYLSPDHIDECDGLIWPRVLNTS